MRKVLSLLLLSFLFVSACSQNKKEIIDSEAINGSHTRGLKFIGEHQTQIAILGTFHFANPGLDDYKEQFAVDMSSPEKQAEIQEVLKKLVAFRPTKVLVEAPRIEADSILLVRYKDYISGSYELPINETYLIGFRLAKELGHQKVYPYDVRPSKWFGADIDWENYNSDEYEKSLGQYNKTHRYDFEKIYRNADSLKSVQSLLEHYKFLNDSEYALTDHQQYLTNTILTGAGDLYNGADNVARWYQRNLRIYANVYDVTDFETEEKILLIAGVGHVHQLKQLFTDSPDFEYLEINEILE